ncbi:MAG: hypothetical protein JRF63_10825 [Deltaproteobacteria bacterium]|nr:hypothetical protein [Deltaproteobacteria bacterium]
MGRRAPTGTLLALALMAFACSEPRPLQHDGKRSEQATPKTEETTVQPAGPGGEMITGLALPAPIEGAKSAASDASREALLEDLGQALSEGRVLDAAAIADVLLVLDAKDAEALELRARALELHSDHEGAGADRKRCCELGRTSCCR